MTYIPPPGVHAPPPANPPIISKATGPHCWTRLRAHDWRTVWISPDEYETHRVCLRCGRTKILTPFFMD